jgi:RHS repeat-associated protein
MKKLAIAIFLLVFKGTGAWAQSPTDVKNYVMETTVKVAGKKLVSDLTGLSAGQVNYNIKYLDGFGRPVQEIAIAASPGQKDMVRPIVYDQLGRQTTGYLSYISSTATGEFQGVALMDQAIFYGTTGQKIAMDSSPFSQQVFENSPLQRMFQSGSVGAGFQPGEHYKSMSYRSNTSGETIRQWNPDGSAASSYATGTLSVTIATGEEGEQAIVYADKNGKTVLKKQYLNDGGVTWIETYYVYDQAGQLVYIIPPKAMAAMVTASDYDLAQSGLNGMLYHYAYNEKGQVIEKIVPGGGVLYMIYDPLDRLVLAQDANLRANDQWNYIKYDYKGRLVSQGIYINTTYTTRSGMQGYVSGLSYASDYAEERNTSSTYGYYTNSIFPTSNITPLAFSYFDDYDLDGNGTADYSYAAQGLSGEATSTTFTRGMQTMVRKRTVGNGLADIWLTNVIFYDSEGRAVQTLSNNQLHSTVDNSKTVVTDFLGKPLVTKTEQVAGATTTTIISEFAYDHRDRLTTIDETYNGGSTVRIAGYFYNELGQLIDKKLHSTNSGSNYLQSLDYRYTIRGQLSSINNSTLTSNGLNDETDDVFGMELLYEQADTGIGNTGYYNGMISAVKWKADAPGVAPTSNERSYKFDYDKLLRLKNATYGDRSGSGSWGNTGAYDEKNISYDVNGNILTLERNAILSSSIVAVDDLAYSYTGDKLDNVSDGSGGSYGLFGFKNLTSSGTAYNYDANGNLVADPKKGLTFDYNVLNRTGKITVTTSTNRFIEYTYSADGKLLRRQAFDNNVLVKTTDYVDGFVYEDSALKYFGMAEGRVRDTGSGLKNEYMITDQKGNVRVSFEEQSGAAVVRQENSYYPFGLTMPGSTVPSADNKNLYNGGSEWQNDFADLPDLQQTFYRNYDPALGRFIAVDPMAEASDSYGTYHYAMDNPVMFNDPLGDAASSTMTTTQYISQMIAVANKRGQANLSFHHEWGNKWTDEDGEQYIFTDNPDMLSKDDIEYGGGGDGDEPRNRFRVDQNGDYVVDGDLQEVNIKAYRMSPWERMTSRSENGRDIYTFADGSPDYGAIYWVQAYGQNAGWGTNNPMQKAIYDVAWFYATGEIIGVGGKALWNWGKGLYLSSKAVEEGTNLVYQGFDKAGLVKYVGITEREAAVRFGEHISSGTSRSLLRYEVIPGATGLSRTAARVWEQTLINQYGLQRNGGILLNKINSIAPRNWWQYGL